MFAAGVSFLASCGGGGGGSSDPVPTVDFTITTAPEDFKVGALIFVEFKGKDAKSYEWDFGDNSDLRVNRVDTAVYRQPGTYTITLTAFSQSGRKGVSAKKSRTITVGPGNYLRVKEIRLYKNYNWSVERQKTNRGRSNQPTNEVDVITGWASPSIDNPDEVSVRFLMARASSVKFGTITDSIRLISTVNIDISPVALKQLGGSIVFADLYQPSGGSVMGSFFRTSQEQNLLSQLPAGQNYTQLITYRLNNDGVRNPEDRIPDELLGQPIYRIIYDIIVP
jgi:hypothetical protein